MTQAIAAIPSDQATIRLELLGGFRLSAGPESLALPTHARRLMAAIALNPTPRSRAYLAGTLWADSSETKANSALRAALWRIRKHSAEIVVSDTYDLHLVRDVAVDVRSRTRLAQRLIDREDPCEDLDLDPSLLAQVLLPGWYEDWVLVQRESVLQLFMHALEAMAERLEERGETSAAIQACLAAIAHEPLRESAHRLLIQLHIAHGNPGEALRHAKAFGTRLGEELGAEPSPQLQNLVASLTSR